MGVIIYEAANKYIKPFGTIFLNLIKFIVVPIVLFSIMCGIISMKDVRKVGSIGLKTVVYYMCTTAVAIVIGLVGGNLFRGMFPVIATTDLAYEAAESTSLMDTIVNIFPSNFISPMVNANMLQIIVMALLIGFAIVSVGEKNVTVVNAFNDLNEVFMKCMEMILRLSPIGVFCLLCPVIAENGPAIIGSLAMVLLAAYICYLVHVLVVYSLTVRAMGGLSPVKFFKGMMPAILFAFSSASSVGTLPLNMECTQKHDEFVVNMTMLSNNMTELSMNDLRRLSQLPEIILINRRSRTRTITGRTILLPFFMTSPAPM